MLLPIPRWFLTLSIILVCATFSVAQKQLSIHVQKPIFLDEFDFIYNTNPGFALRYSKLTQGDSRVTLGPNGDLGIFLFRPKEDNFYYLLSPTEYGTATYSNYFILQLTGGYSWLIDIGERNQLLTGLNAGFYYVSFRIHRRDKYIDTDATNIEGKGAIVPEIGWAYSITDKIGIQYKFKSELFFSLGSSNPENTNYNPNAGTFNYFASNSLGLRYNF